jgi:hypothetical protein
MMRVQGHEELLVPASLAVADPPRFLLGAKLTVVGFAGMEEQSLRSLERICRAQAALTTHEPTKRGLESMTDEYRRLSDLQDRQQHQE